MELNTQPTNCTPCRPCLSVESSCVPWVAYFSGDSTSSPAPWPDTTQLYLEPSSRRRPSSPQADRTITQSCGVVSIPTTPAHTNRSKATSRLETAQRKNDARSATANPPIQTFNHPNLVRGRRFGGTSARATVDKQKQTLSVPAVRKRNPRLVCRKKRRFSQKSAVAPHEGPTPARSPTVVCTAASGAARRP